MRREGGGIRRGEREGRGGTCGKSSDTKCININVDKIKTALSFCSPWCGTGAHE